MPITWRPATWADVEPGLSIDARKWGDALTGRQAAVECWRQIVRDPFFASAVLESHPAIKGHRLVAFGASVFVSSAFADAEIASPRPDINSRVIASIHAGRPVLATRGEVALANAGEGVDVVILGGSWRDQILNPAQRQEVHTLLPSSFAKRMAGFRIRRILYETGAEAEAEFARHSVVYRTIAEFPESGRVLHIMDSDSVRAIGGSLGTIIFSYRDPVLRLRSSDQELLLAALGGATDAELAATLGVRPSAIKARWRSTFARIEAEMPGLVSDGEVRLGRGLQKRHRVLGHMRNHPEELQPYAWQGKS